MLHAETLVRDEIFAKNAAAAAAAAAVAGGSTPKTVVKNPHYYNHHHHHHHHNYSANNSSSNNSSSSHHHHPVLPVGLIAVETGANRHGAASTAHSQHHHHHHHHGHGRKAEKAMSNLKMNLIEVSVHDAFARPTRGWSEPFSAWGWYVASCRKGNEPLLVPLTNVDGRRAVCRNWMRSSNAGST